ARAEGQRKDSGLSHDHGVQPHARQEVSRCPTIPSALQRVIEDMTARRFGEDTQRDYVRAVKNFAVYLRLFAGQGVGRGPSPISVASLQQHISPATINQACT